MSNSRTAQSVQPVVSMDLFPKNVRSETFPPWPVQVCLILRELAFQMVAVLSVEPAAIRSLVLLTATDRAAPVTP